MEDKNQTEFLINKLLTVSESTIENLVKLKETLSNSEKDHTRQNEMLDSLINCHRDLENTLNNFKDRKPFEVFERIEDKQDNTANTLKIISDKVCNPKISDDLTEIRTNVDFMRAKEDSTVKWVKILSAISTIAIIIMAMFKIFFEDTKIEEQEIIKKIIQELNVE